MSQEISQDEIMFFADQPGLLHLYASVRGTVFSRYESVRVKVTKTQIAFRAGYGFAYVWLPPRKTNGRPDDYLILSFGLDHKEEHNRIVETTEPSPGRWTHHIIIARPEDVDSQVEEWLDAAYAFSLQGDSQKSG